MLFAKIFRHRFAIAQQILSLSGRGIQPEALLPPDGVARVDAAIARIDDLLNQVPAEVMQQALALRKPS